jgi:hypothetical protein
MTERKSALSYLGSIIFIFGIILGILLSLVRALPDLESTMYGFYKFGYPNLSSLSCPLLMTPSDQEDVTIKLKNNLDRPITWHIEAQFSADNLINTITNNEELQPGESRVLSWEVNHNNISLGNFIFARVYTSAAAAQERREAYCGTLVINLPFAGGPTVYYSSILVTAICLGLGLWLWRRHTLLNEPTPISQFLWMRFGALLVVLGIVAGFMDWWSIAIILVVLIILTTVVFLIPRKI